MNVFISSKRKIFQFHQIFHVFYSSENPCVSLDNSSQIQFWCCLPGLMPLLHIWLLLSMFLTIFLSPCSILRCFLLVLYLFETGSRYVAYIPASTLYMLRLINAALLSRLSFSHMHSLVLRQSLLRYRWLGSHSSFLCRSHHYFVFQIVVVQNFWAPKSTSRQWDLVAIEFSLFLFLRNAVLNTAPKPRTHRKVIMPLLDFQLNINKNHFYFWRRLRWRLVC